MTKSSLCRFIHSFIQSLENLINIFLSFSMFSFWETRKIKYSLIIQIEVSIQVLYAFLYFFLCALTQSISSTIYKTKNWTNHSISLPFWMHFQLVHTYHKHLLTFVFHYRKWEIGKNLLYTYCINIQYKRLHFMCGFPHKSVVHWLNTVEQPNKQGRSPNNTTEASRTRSGNSTASFLVVLALKSQFCQ